MAILVSADVRGQTAQGYDLMLSALQALIQKAPGFVCHFSHPIEGGWRVMELWHSKADADRWYASHVAPNLPPGIVPKRLYQELHSIVTP